MRYTSPAGTPIARPPSDDVAKARQRLNFLNIRTPDPRKSGILHSTDRLTFDRGVDTHNQMVERSLDLTFAALADPTRRAMLASLQHGEASIGDLAAPHAMSFAGAAKHVGVLERAGLVERRRAGRQILCRLQAGRLAEAEAWLRQWERFWTVRLDALDSLLAADRKETDDG